MSMIADLSALSLGQAKLIICFASVPAAFETCHLNCHYHHPINDMPTFNVHSSVDLLSTYKHIGIMNNDLPHAHKSSKWLLRNKPSLPGFTQHFVCLLPNFKHMEMNRMLSKKDIS